MKVYVLSRERTPLMPTTERRARLWLKAGRARVVHREPFTIQLRFDTTTYTQPVRVGVDTGSQTVGIACATCNQAKGNQTAAEFGFPQVQAQAQVSLTDAAHVSSVKTAIMQQLRDLFGSDWVAITYGYETKYKRIQILGLPKSHTNDAIAIACAIGEVVKPRAVAYHIHCISRGQYQLHNGKRSEHKVWAPRKVKGWKLYELVKVKGRIGYIGGRRIKGAFVVKDLMSGKAFVEVTPRKLERLARPVQGWMITRLSSPQIIAKEGGASSPV